MASTMVNDIKLIIRICCTAITIHFRILLYSSQIAFGVFKVVIVIYNNNYHVAVAIITLSFIPVR